MPQAQNSGNKLKLARQFPPGLWVWTPPLLRHGREGKGVGRGREGDGRRKRGRGGEERGPDQVYEDIGAVVYRPKQ